MGHWAEFQTSKTLRLASLFLFQLIIWFHLKEPALQKATTFRGGADQKVDSGGGNSWQKKKGNNDERIGKGSRRKWWNRAGQEGGRSVATK